MARVLILPARCIGNFCKSGLIWLKLLHARIAYEIIQISRDRREPGKAMSYYMSAMVQTSFDGAIERVEAALQKEGFGVISRIDIQQTLKAKLGVDFRPYTILGACNPGLAHQALLLEDKVGTMLPCNVVVQQTGDGEVEVAAIDPVASMQAILNPELTEAAKKVRARLALVIAAL